jgi:small-conductance mechanosensitive channel
MEQIKEYANQALEVSIAWLTSPAAWGQAAFIIGAFLAAFIARKYLTKFLVPLLNVDDEDQSILAKLRRFLVQFLPLLLPILAYVFLGLSEQAAKSTFGASEVIAFGKRAFMLLGASIFVNKIIYSPFLKLLGKYVIIPIAALYTVGLLGPAANWLDSNSLGEDGLTILDLVRGGIVGAFLFWLGRWSNDQSATYIRSQEDMRVPTRELASKTAEMAIFAGCFLLLMKVVGLDLSFFAILGGAIGVGLGFGLQKIASNFISGIILLLEGQATVGDFVELDGGEAGTIVKMMSRATILETFDGKWIVVPNEDFIVTRVTNWSDSGSGNRYEAEFSVSYDTDINKVPALIEAAVAKHPGVITKPEAPDCELRGFGDSGIDFAVEFWVEGIDDGKNKYTSDVLFIIWNTLRENDIEIPYPHRVVEIKGGLPTT